VAAQAGVSESRRSTDLRWVAPIEFVAGQFALLLGYWFVVWVLAIVQHRPRSTAPIGLRYLWWMSVPTFAVFAGSSLLKAGQINWPVSAYLSGGVLTAGSLVAYLSGTRSRWPVRVFVAALGIGFALTLLAHNTRLATRIAGPVIPDPTPGNPIPIRAFDPAARLKGWGHLGNQLDVLRGRIRAQDGTDPVLAGLRWDVPGLLSIYTEGHPQAYSLGLMLRYDRHSQYDLWHPNPVDDAQAFRGRTFLVVGPGDPSRALALAFESVGAPQEVVYWENGRPHAIWYVCVCRGYRGIDPAQQPGAEAGH
jgi:hypothetical protein